MISWCSSGLVGVHRRNREVSGASPLLVGENGRVPIEEELKKSNQIASTLTGLFVDHLRVLPRLWNGSLAIGEGK